MLAMTVVVVEKNPLALHRTQTVHRFFVRPDPGPCDLVAKLIEQPLGDPVLFLGLDAAVLPAGE